MIRRKVLLIAFHFPPFSTSSGLQRTLSLANQLPSFDWEPLVLTANVLAYPAAERLHSELVPAELTICRSFALDAKRHFSVFGRYPRALAIPDRWSSWFYSAVPAGLSLVKKHSPSVIWSTYPLATAHLIGAAIARRTQLPWVADFRDPMIEQIGNTWYPSESRLRAARLKIEKQVAHFANAASFCTATARDIFVARHGCRDAASNYQVIANGFDEGSFSRAERLPATPVPDHLHIVHSGTLYPGPDRDPTTLLKAMAQLRSDNRLPQKLRVTLRATGHDSVFQPLIRELDLTRYVELAPPLPYDAALREMLDADGLLLFQGKTSNPAIPAKAYEYIRARRPILALAAEDGETARMLRGVKAATIASFDDVDRTTAVLDRFLNKLQSDFEKISDDTIVSEYSRTKRVEEFADLFSRVSSLR